MYSIVFIKLLAGTVAFATTPSLPSGTCTKAMALFTAPMTVKIEPVKFHEFTSIRYGEQNYPTRSFISPEYYRNLTFAQDEGGDHLRLLVRANSTGPSNTRSLIPSQSQGSALAVKDTGTNVAELRANHKLKPEEISHLADLYMEKHYADALDSRPQSRESIKAEVIQLLLRYPKTLNEVIETTQRPIAAAHEIMLSNTGIEKYFWIKPQGLSAHFPARVLDIHWDNSPTGITILAEYLGHDSNNGGERTRFVFEISEYELKTIKRDDQFSAEEARLRFSDTLTPLEADTIALALKLKVKLFGYVNIHRKPNKEDTSPVKTPLSNMTGHLWRRSTAEIEKIWGNVDDLKTPVEKVYGSVNIYDLFSRLNPDYVLSRFSKIGFQYNWVITEDGKLKIVPIENGDARMHGSLLRLSSGRKIYAGGIMTINKDGSLNLTLESKDFQEIDVRWENKGAFAHDNPNLYTFVSAVFHTQVSRQVHIQSAMAPIMNRSDSGSGYNRANESDPSRFSFFDEDYEFISRMKAQKQFSERTKSAEGSEHSWDLKTGYPLDFNVWNKGTYTQWAHYVLKSDDNMTLDEIRTNKKAMVKRFSEESRNNNPQGQNAVKTISEAWVVIKSKFIAPPTAEENANAKFSN